MFSNEDIRNQTEKLGVDCKGKVSVYKYIDVQGGEKLIENKTFKFSKPKDFNDPFDLYDDLIDFNNHAVNAPAGYTRKEKRKVKNASLKKNTLLLKQSWKLQKNTYGITCFSKTYKDILMWSHYADKHSGICIGFEIDVKKLLDIGFIAFAVEYEQTFLPRPYSKEDLEEQMKTIMQYVSMKAKFWEYEKEVRFVNFDYFLKHTSEYLNFGEFAEIKEICFGLKTKEFEKKKIKKLFSKTNCNVSYYEMAAIKNEFKLVRLKKTSKKK